MMNSRESIKAEFTSIDERIDRKITVYLMGGGAMTFRGLKNATYDLDLLVTTRRDFESLRDLLLGFDYNRVKNLPMSTRSWVLPYSWRKMAHVDSIYLTGRSSKKSG